MPDVRDRQYLITVHKKARKSGLDLHAYNQLKDQLACVQTDLARLKDPLLPPHRARAPPYDPSLLDDPRTGGGLDGTVAGLWAGLKGRLVKSLRDGVKGDSEKAT